MIFNFTNLSDYGQALKSTSTDIGELSKLTSRLTLEQTANVLSTKALTTEEMAQILANKGVVKSEAEAVAAKVASSTANGVATFSLKAYTTALWTNIKAMAAWMFSNPVGWILAIAGAVGVAIATYNYFNETIEEQKEKISDLKDEYENTVQELNTLGDEIENNNKRLEDLKAKGKDGTLTLIEEDEIKKLTLANKLLKEQQDIKKDEEIEQAEELSKANQRTFTEEFGSDINIDDIANTSSYSMYGARILDGENLSDKELILSIKALYTGINDSIEIGDEETTEALSEGQEYLLSILRERSSSMLTELLEYQETLSKLMNPDGTFDDVNNKQMWDDIEEWKKEIYKQTDSSGEWNTLQIDVALSDTSLQKTLGEVQQKFVNGTLTENDIAQYSNLNTALEEANLILEEGQTPASIYLQYLNSIATSQNVVNSSIPDFTFDSSNQEVIDKYQSDLSSLSETLDKVNNKNLSSSELLDLLQSFPMLTNKTDDLASAIQFLIDDKLEKLKSTLENTGASDEILDLFDNLTNESRNFSLDEVLSGLESTHSMIETVKNEVKENGKISVSTLQSIVNQYPGLNQSVDDYLQNKSTEKDLLKDLQEEYEIDLQNYKLYMAQKKGEDEGFYDLVVAGLSTDLIDKAKQYGIELANYTNYLEAKLAMDKEYASKKAQLETVNASIEQAAENYAGGAPVTLTTMKMFETKGRLEGEISDIEEIIKGVNTSISTVIPDFRTDLPFSSSSDSDNDTEDKFASDYDWIARSVENAKREVEKLDKTLSNAGGFTKRLETLELLKVANQELVDATKEASTEYEDIWEAEASKVDSKYQELITGDRSKLKIENFDNEDEYNNVIRAVEAYDTWQDSLSQHEDALEKQKADEDAITATYLERSELQLEIHNLSDQENMTLSEKNEWLEKEKLIKAEILKYNLAMASTEEERLKLQAEYDKYLEENESTQYDNERKSRSNQTDFYDTEIQDIQNDISLSEARGGRGTVEQYSTMNRLQELKKKIYKEDAKAAKTKRDSEEEGTDIWNEYNEQLQEAEDNINKCTIAQIENNKAIKLLPVKKYEDLNKVLEKRLNSYSKQLEKVESAFGHAAFLIQNEIDILNERKEVVSDGYDKQIKLIQEQRDLLTESNDELQRSIDLENAKYNLEKAIRNKTTRIYRAGQGFVYESDQDAIREAQQELDTQNYNNTIANLDKQIDELQKNKEDNLLLIDEEIKSWDEYAKKLDVVSNSYDRLIAKRDFLSLFFSSGENRILQQDEGILKIMEAALNNAKANVDSIQSQIDENNNKIEELQEEAEAFLDQTEEMEEAQKEIEDATLKSEEEALAIKSQSETVKELFGLWQQLKIDIATTLAESTIAHNNAKDAESSILSERLANIEAFKNAIVDLYNQIAAQLDKAKSSFSSITEILVKTEKTYNEILSYQKKANEVTIKKEKQQHGVNAGGLSENYVKLHSGGIVGEPTPKNKLPDNLIALTNDNLKPNETLAKLLNGEVVLNNNQMGNIFNNLNRAYSSILTPLNKRENSPMEITIGDINVYNPDNSDMIVDEIVKELPLKVIQRLHSK